MDWFRLSPFFLMFISFPFFKLLLLLLLLLLRFVFQVFISKYQSVYYFCWSSVVTDIFLSMPSSQLIYQAYLSWLVTRLQTDKPVLKTALSRNSDTVFENQIVIGKTYCKRTLKETPCYERHTQAMFLICDRKHDEINPVRKVTRFKNVPMSAAWTVSYSRSFIVDKTGRQPERGNH